MPNPSKTSPNDLLHYEFLGLMMAVCIRTGSVLVLDMPKIFWKRLVGQKIDLNDFEEVDKQFVKRMKEILALEEKDFNVMPRFWQTTYSCADGSNDQVDLTENGTGDSRLVTYDERIEYVCKCLEVRLHECAPQCEAIRRGIGKVVPEALMNTVSFSELEDWVCGSKFVDVSLLRKCTVYAGEGAVSKLPFNDESPVIKMFWEFMHELTPEDKTKFIKFCWGSERIPTTYDTFRSVIRRVQIKAAPHAEYSQDARLPRADTCFFNFELPEYSTKEILSSKIMKAIIMDNEGMDKDENAGRIDHHG